MNKGAKLTAAQEIILAADDLAMQGRADFSEWDLTIATWNRDKNRFGMRGHEGDHPDHKRVMMEIMGQTKPDNPLRRGFIEKLRPNQYRITDLGKSEAQRLRKAESFTNKSIRSPGPIFDTLEPFINHRSFSAWLANPEEPRTWLGAAAFLQLAENTPNELNDRIRSIETAIRHALEWLTDTGRTSITRGPHGGGEIPSARVAKLREFVAVLQQRFHVQMDSIRKKGR